MPSKKIDAVIHLSSLMVIEDAMTLLRISRYLRNFVPNYSIIVVPMSDMLSDPRFRSKGS